MFKFHTFISGCLLTRCLAYAGSASCSSLLIFSLSLSGVRPGVKPGVTAPRGVIPPPAWGVMPSCPWPCPGVLLEMTTTVTFYINIQLHGTWFDTGDGFGTWMVCWGQCWASVSVASEESLRWSRSRVEECWGLLSEECQCWSKPSGSGLPENTDTGGSILTPKVSLWWSFLPMLTCNRKICQIFCIVMR